MEYTIKSVDWRTTETDVGNQNKYREVKEINTVCNVGTNGDVFVWVCVCFPYFRMANTTIFSNRTEAIEIFSRKMGERSRLHYFKTSSDMLLSIAGNLIDSISGHIINFLTHKLQNSKAKKKPWRNFLQTITVKPSSALTFNRWRRKSATRRKMLKTWATCKFSQSWFISCGKSENISGVKKSRSEHWLNQSIHK